MNAEKWERIARALKTEDIGNKPLGARLGVSSTSVARVRADLGMPAFRHRLKVWTPEEFERAAPKIQGGHRLWKGRFGPGGFPMANRTLTAYRLSFRLHHGREPVGRVRGVCRLARCVDGAHLQDDLARAAQPECMTLRGLDVEAVRAALRCDPPYPPLSLAEARLGFRLAPVIADPEVTAVELADRLSVTARTVERWKRDGAPPPW